MSQTFCNNLVNISAVLVSSAEVLKIMNHTVRYPTYLVQSQCYSSDLPLWLWAWFWNLYFQAYLTLLHLGCYNLSKISSTICLLYYGQQHLKPFTQQMIFLVASATLWPSSNSQSVSSLIWQCCMFICVARLLTQLSIESILYMFFLLFWFILSTSFSPEYVLLKATDKVLFNWFFFWWGGVILLNFFLS